MAYMMLLTGDVKTGGFVLAGYSTVRIVPEKELKLLRVSNNKIIILFSHFICT